jgi:ATP-dependent DNA helicase RecG
MSVSPGEILRVLGQLAIDPASVPPDDVRACLGRLESLAAGDGALVGAVAKLAKARTPEAQRVAAASLQRAVSQSLARGVGGPARPASASGDSPSSKVVSGTRPEGGAQAPTSTKGPRARSSHDARRDAARQRRQSEAIAADEAGALEAPDRPVESLPGIGPRVGDALRRRGIDTVGELALLLPRRYDDERRTTPFGELAPGTRHVVVGVVAAARSGGGRRRFVEVTFEPTEDERGGRIGMLRCIWFQAGQGLAQRFPRGARFRLAGLVDEYRGVLSMSHPDASRLDGEADAHVGVTPRYPELPGVPARLVARAARTAVERLVGAYPEAVPATVRAAERMPALVDALRALHHPPADLDDAALAAWNDARTTHHARLAYEEFFLLELALHTRRSEEAGLSAEALVAPAAPVARARAALPFALTDAQSRALAEITADLGRDAPMRRLLQGDVGCGKTAVAMLACAHTVAAGAQAVLMAPTEVLAEQHFRALEPLGRALGLRMALVVGGARASHKRSVRKALAEGTIDVAVGTHALLVEGVVFRRLRLVVVDEQHRFGVSQRLRLVEKSGGVQARPVLPHLLVMTATPIPRTLALALYGDLDVSAIDAMPPGRRPPVTRAYPEARREDAYVQLTRALDAGGQAFVVCPLVEESDEVDLRDATRTYEELRERFADRGVELLHGRLPAEQKQRAMERFAKGEVRVLVATTVVEVGVDVPRANVILVEHAERFGLAQLHQLRGRVGRGGQPSACLLVHRASGDDAVARLRVLCETSDGFRIAEEDLRIRGPGELFGRKQSGLPGFRFGDLRRDLALLERAREAARQMLAIDPALAAPAHEGARRALARLASSPRSVVREEAG